MRRLAPLLLPVVAACTATPPPRAVVPVAIGPGTAAPAAPARREVQLLAINDFHGNLEAPGISVDGAAGKVPVGGLAYLGSALKAARTPASITVAAGDLIGASPLISSMFYDEPTAQGLSLVGLDLASVGNHEFDRGWQELKRLQAGGCRPFVAGDLRRSCPDGQPFTGAGFTYLAANVRLPGGTTLFPAIHVRDIGGVRVGFIGMTLKATGTLVSPGGVEGLSFDDEADTANALVPRLRQLGARTIVLLIHEGGSTSGKYDDPSCPGLNGDILKITDRLDPAIATVVSGHTHQAYLCRIPAAGGGQRLLTSSGRYGALVADIRLGFDAAGALLDQSARFIEVQGEPVTIPGREAPLNPARTVYAADPAAAALVARYKALSEPIARRPVGRIERGVAQRAPMPTWSPGAMLIADSMLYAARPAAKGGAQLALMNIGGARADLPPGALQFGDLFRMQPFGNTLVTMSFTGAELKAILEQMFNSGTNTAAQPYPLLPSANFRFAYDRSRAPDQRIVWMELDGKRIVPTARYRLVTNNFLAAGGDSFTAFTKGRDGRDGGLDIDAMTAYIAAGKVLPTDAARIVDLTPASWVAPTR